MKINTYYPFYKTTVFENFRVMADQVAEQYPDRTAYSFRRKPADEEIVRISFTTARDDMRDLATGFLARDIVGRHVALIGEATYEWILCFYSLLAANAVLIPIDRDLPATDIRDILERSGSDYVIYSPTVATKVGEALDGASVRPVRISLGDTTRESETLLRAIKEDGHTRFLDGDTVYSDRDIDIKTLAMIVFTSGTTGKGKGVMLSQENICLDMTNGMYLFDITPKTINFLPPHHTFGSTVNFVGHFSQGSEVYLSSGLRYIASEIREQQPTHLVLVPLFLEKLCSRIWSKAEETGKDKTLRRMIRISNLLRKVGIDLRRKIFKSVLEPFGGRLEMVICGGAALKQDIIDTFDGIGITIMNGYGITECAPLVACNRNKKQKAGSVGLPILHEEVKILAPDENGEGEICVKGPNVMLGYYQDEEATAAAFTEDGFFRTGDYGKIDEEGWLYITGRLKNLIILSNGKNVYPEEIETSLSQIRGVLEVIVYAGESRSQKEKEVIVAEIFPDKELLESDGVTDIEAYFDREVKRINRLNPSYKTVNLVKIRTEEFSKNTSKKITRFNLDKSID